MSLDLRALSRGIPGADHVERGLYRSGLIKLDDRSGPVALPHRLSHRELLTPLRLGDWRAADDDKPGAVVVPTGRPGTAPRSGIPFASRLALHLGCPLVVLVSHEAGSKEGMEALERQITVSTDDGPVQPDTLVLKTLPRPTKLTVFGVDRLRLSRAYRRGVDVFGEGRVKINDVGRKRNLALLLAAGMNWSSVLLLDDDMFADVDGEGGRRRPHERTLDPHSLRCATRAVESGHLAAGWVARSFDDNSVLCRVAGQMGAAQDQFVGGGALLVPISAEVPFFPSIYNEDWIFLLGLLRRRERGSVELLDGGDIHQDEYPAYLASRAAAEELGDVLGEGLMSLVHEDRHDDAESPAFWREALAYRRILRTRLKAQVLDSDHEFRDAMLAALETVESVHLGVADAERYWIGQFIAYSKQLTKDLHGWGRRLHPDDLPKPARLLASKEFDAARTFGRFEHPDDFLRHLAGTGAGDARKSALLQV